MAPAVGKPHSGKCRDDAGKLTVMLVGPILAAFLLGIRHGADPDHIAAIDNLTRTAVRNRAAGFIGTLFAGGHAFMVIAITVLIASAGKLLAVDPRLEVAGSWLSVVILLGLAVANIRRLRDSSATAPASFRTRLFSRLMRSDSSVYAAIPIGFLFGLGFETPTQIAAYVVMVSGGPGAICAIGAAFCLGMMVTDTCDSLFLARLLCGNAPARSGRLWLWAVTVSAIAVALIEAAQLAGVRTGFGELQTSAVLVLALVCVYVISLRSTRRRPTRPYAR